MSFLRVEAALILTPWPSYSELCALDSSLLPIRIGVRRLRGPPRLIDSVEKVHLYAEDSIRQISAYVLPRRGLQARVQSCREE